MFEAPSRLVFAILFVALSTGCSKKPVENTDVSFHGSPDSFEIRLAANARDDQDVLEAIRNSTKKSALPEDYTKGTLQRVPLVPKPFSDKYSFVKLSSSKMRALTREGKADEATIWAEFEKARTNGGPFVWGDLEILIYSRKRTDANPQAESSWENYVLTQGQPVINGQHLAAVRRTTSKSKPLFKCLLSEKGGEILQEFTSKKLPEGTFGGR